MTRLLPLFALFALLPLAACGHPDRAPTLGGNLTDDTRGAHAGSFRTPGAPAVRTDNAATEQRR